MNLMCRLELTNCFVCVSTWSATVEYIWFYFRFYDVYVVELYRSRVDTGACRSISAHRYICLYVSHGLYVCVRMCLCVCERYFGFLILARFLFTQLYHCWPHRFYFLV